MKTPKTFKQFITELAKIVGHRELPATTTRVVSFKNKSRSSTSNSKPEEEKFLFTPEQELQIEKAIAELQEIAGRHSAKFNSSSIKDHFAKRVVQRDKGFDNIIDMFKKLEKNSNFFESLKRLEKKGLTFSRNKWYGPQLVDYTNKIVIGARVGKNKEISLATVLGSWNRKQQQQQKKDTVPFFYAD
jgi:hypothetical protein